MQHACCMWGASPVLSVCIPPSAPPRSAAGQLLLATTPHHTTLHHTTPHHACMHACASPRGSRPQRLEACLDGSDVLLAQVQLACTPGQARTGGGREHSTYKACEWGMAAFSVWFSSSWYGFALFFWHGPGSASPAEVQEGPCSKHSSAACLMLLPDAAAWCCCRCRAGCAHLLRTSPSTLPNTVAFLEFAVRSTYCKYNP